MEHFDVRTLYAMLDDALSEVVKRRYVNGARIILNAEDDSYCEAVHHDRHVTSNIYFNLSEFKDCDLFEPVSDERVAAYLTRVFHEGHHAYQNAKIDTKLQKSKLNREIAAMGVVCEFYKKLYKGGYWTDTREYDAEITGMVLARKYCKKHLPNFDYDSAILEHVRNDSMSLIKGDFKTFDDMMEEAIRMRDSSYGKTRALPEFTVRGDSIDRKFLDRYYAGKGNDQYQEMSGYEQVVKMFDMLGEMGISEGCEHLYLAFYYRYDEQLLYEHKGIDKKVLTMRERRKRACLETDGAAKDGMGEISRQKDDSQITM